MDETFGSVLDQLPEDCELIAVDDGSSDGTLQRLKEYEKEHKGLRVSSIAHGGASAARNRGIDVAEGEKISGEGFVEECTIESVLDLLFPDEYIPTSSERMLVYRELDSLESDEELKKFRTRLTDRFGTIPPTGEELLRVVPLRRLGKQLGIEKILLKGGQMALYFVSNLESPYYDSAAFGRVMNYTAMSPYECRFRELSGKRSLLIKGIGTVEEALGVLAMMMHY